MITRITITIKTGSEIIYREGKSIETEEINELINKCKEILKR